MRIIILGLLYLFSSILSAQELGISPNNPSYWSIDGETTLLIGGSVEDNLFQIAHLDSHLDSLVSVGGNYVRNVMSSRDKGNVWPFAKVDSLYDLRQWNPGYWQRFERFLAATAQRKIIVQLEVWATFDYYRDNWEINPFNPKNNSTYTAQRTKLPLEVPTHPTWTENDFFRSIPTHLNQAQVLAAQQRFVDKILSYTLEYKHILYCIDNETSVSSEWGKFWARYIRMAAREQGKRVFITEMWDPWELSHPMHDETLFNLTYFDFMDISQNNHLSGDAHWNNGLAYLTRMRTLKLTRPVNTIKTYGGHGRFGTEQDGIERLWRSAFLGVAALRFHRPPSGIGLSRTSMATIQSMRMLFDSLDVEACQPDQALLSGREENEAYCISMDKEAVAVYFPAGGEVSLDMSGDYRLQWLDIGQASWQEAITSTAKGTIRLTCPEAGGHWVALLRVGD